jgi:photosystem II stability/assembly factor-like uncharacterized protein
LVCHCFYRFDSSAQGIHKNTNGGNSWTKVLTTGKYTNLFFLTPQQGFPQGFEDFANTPNGGDSWIHKPLRHPDSPGSFFNLARDIFIISASTGYLLVSNSLYKTIDTGNTWNLSYSKPSYSIFFLDINRGYLYSEEKIYKTDNGGNTWLPIGNITVSGLRKKIGMYYNLLMTKTVCLVQVRPLRVRRMEEYPGIKNSLTKGFRIYSFFLKMLDIL